MGSDPPLHTLRHTGGAKGEGAFPHGHKTISICLQDRPHRWVSWGHAAAGTCGKEMSLCSALDIHVIQSIAPMCKKSTKVAPFQMAGNAECQGQRQILSQSRALFYFNWVGLGEATEVMWGWERQQQRLGTSPCPFLWSHITSGLKLLKRCHRDLEMPGQAHQRRGVCKFLPFPLPKSLPHPRKEIHRDFPHDHQHNKTFPLGFWCPGITLSLQTFTPTPGLPEELSWSCQAPVKACLIPRNASQGCEPRLLQLSLKWIFPLREDFFGLVLLKRNLQ